jgi:TnpA family transposase
VEPADRPATATQHAQRIREHLDYRPFDDEAHEKLRQVLLDRARERALSDTLMGIAVTTLRAWRVELPGRWLLDRLITACVARGEEAAWLRICERLPPEFRVAVDGLLAVPEGDRRSALFDLKQYPPDARPSTIKEYIERFALLRSLGFGDLNLAGVVGAEVVQHLADFGRRYDVGDLKRFQSAKRYAIVACFLVEAQKTILDHIVEMHREYLTGMARRARNTVDQRHREVRQRANKSLATVLRAMEIVTDESMPQESRILNLYMQFDGATLRDAMSVVRDLHELSDRGYFDELLVRYSHFRRYFSAFVALPFRAEPGNDGLLAAIELARKLGPGEPVPPDAPRDFATGAWRATLAAGDRPTWELGLAFAMRDALRSGDLYLAESRDHVSFWNLVHDAKQWEEKRSAAYETLHLPTEADHAVHRLRAELDRTVQELVNGLDANPFASLREGRLEYARQDAEEEPASVRELRRAIEPHLPRIRIEDLLIEVDAWCGFTRELVPLGGHPPRVDNFSAALYAALVAHGTNLGLTTMAQSTKGLSFETLHHVARWYLRPETLKAANRVLVDYLRGLSIASAWGEGSASSSDGQRFGIQAPSLLASFYPRYFGYYDRAVTVYTHMSDQFSVFGSRVISCSPREALYVLDGLLENATVLRPREHYTDTHGFTEQLFGLCYLLGFSFMPRLKDLKDQQLYRLGRTDATNAIASVFRSTVDVALIGEQWDQLVRVAASLHNRTAPAHVILERLAASSPSDRLAKALTMLGRVVKTTYILRYAHDAELRGRVHRQLNRGEARHALARRLFFANQGSFRVGDYEEIMNKVSALSLLSNAVVVWNAVQFAKSLAALEARQQPASVADLARLWPLAHAHVIPSGTYHFDRASDGGRRLE